MYGRGLSSTNRRMPSAIRCSVFSASGRLRSKIEGQGIDQSMHSAAVRTGAPVGAAFDALAASTGLPLVARFADGVAAALQGAPAACVPLLAQSTGLLRVAALDVVHQVAVSAAGMNG